MHCGFIFRGSARARNSLRTARVACDGISRNVRTSNSLSCRRTSNNRQYAVYLWHQIGVVLKVRALIPNVNKKAGSSCNACDLCLEVFGVEEHD